VIVELTLLQSVAKVSRNSQIGCTFLHHSHFSVKLAASREKQENGGPGHWGKFKFDVADLAP